MNLTLEKYDDHIIEIEKREYAQEDWYKPRGFWVTIPGDDDWLQWSIENSFHIERLRYRHNVTLKPEANILYLTTVKEILDFHEQYKKSLSPVHNRLLYIDWPTVTAQYDGIIIAPYQWSLRLDLDLIWYNTWDVASGCIWNTDMIDTITPTLLELEELRPLELES